MPIDFTAESLAGLSYREMQKLCKENSLKASGKGAELKERLQGLLTTSSSTTVLAALDTNVAISMSPSAFKCFAGSAPPIQASPMKAVEDARDLAEPALVVEDECEQSVDSLQLPSPIDAPKNEAQFANDGTFLAMFHQMEQEQQAEPWTEAPPARNSLSAFAGLREQPPPPAGSPHSEAVSRMRHKPAASGDEDNFQEADRAEIEAAIVRRPVSVKCAVPSL